MRKRRREEGREEGTEEGTDEAASNPLLNHDDSSSAFDFNQPDPIRASASAETLLWHRREQRVVQAFRHAWTGYTQHAWGHDTLHPLSQTSSDWFGLGLTAIDALDTAYLMGQHDIYIQARDWVATSLDPRHPLGTGDSNVFEITIRVIGGLLSAHHLSNDTVLLDKAVEMANVLMVAFDSPSGIPYASVRLADRVAVQSTMSNGASSTAEATTLQMEFKYLSVLTGDPKYWNAVQNTMKVVLENLSSAHDGLVPIFIDVMSGKFVSNEIRLGSRGDSYYEYLIKQWLQTGKSEPRLLKQYRAAVSGIRNHLLGISTPSKLLFVGERPSGIHGPLSSKMDHLVCFLPGTLALGATGGKRLATRDSRAALPLRDQQDLDLAEELARSCYEMYHQCKAGLSPEIVFWNTGRGGFDHRRSSTTASDATILAYHQNRLTSAQSRFAPDTNTHNVPYDDETDAATRSGAIGQTPLGDMGNSAKDFDIHAMDGHNLLRPETVESLFVLYRITGKRKYREWAWRIFRAFEKWCRVNGGGYTSLDDVRVVPPPQRDKMESFFVGETLKYFYLIFNDDTELIDLSTYVFNTEAHPLPVFDMDAMDKAVLRRDLLWLK
ncbi:hypothetical protein BASA60_004001 [Batrachochytrium salamandrivorans]|nr:hypothetical protein BASA60_004001 [Batrachochytrium salamandrivorans]